LFRGVLFDVATEFSQPTKVVVADADDMICCFMVNFESSNTPKSWTTSTDVTTTEPMEREDDIEREDEREVACKTTKH